MGNAGEIMENNIEELYKAIKAVGELAGNQVTDDDIKEKLDEPCTPCADNEKALEHLKNGVDIFFESINEKYKSEEKGKYLTEEQFKDKVGKLVMFAADEIVAENIDSTISVPGYIWILDNWNSYEYYIMKTLKVDQQDLKNDLMPINIFREKYGMNYTAVIRIFDDEGKLDLYFLKLYFYFRALSNAKNKFCSLYDIVKKYNTAHKNIIQIREALKKINVQGQNVNFEKELEDFRKFSIIYDNKKNKFCFYNKYRLEDMDIYFDKRAVVCYSNKEDRYADNPFMYINPSSSDKVNQKYNPDNIYKNKKRCVFIINHITNEIKNDSLEDVKKYADNYLWIYEPVNSIQAGQIPIWNACKNEYFKMLCNDVPIIRIGNIDDKGYVVLVKVRDENDKLSLSHLKDYLVSTNSCIFKDITYVRPIESESTVTDARNVLVFGAPGTGKSHWVKETIDKLVEKNADGQPRTCTGEEEEYRKDREKYIKNAVTRVTFYEDYSYENFVGCYKPVSDEDNGKKVITYKFRPGPFINVYVNATKDPERSYYLVIEEINRARAASVFGDMFQLLDRNGNGKSEYDIVPDTELVKYLEEKLGNKFDGRMKLPQNMYIYATMNSADQGVYPLDSAFKRRWSFVYKSVDEVYKGKDGEAARPIRVKLKGNEKDKAVNIEWDVLRRAINKKLEIEHIEEDKLLGYWFLNNTELKQIEAYIDGKETGMPNPMADKLYSYLFQDVVRMNPEKIFKKGKKGVITMSMLRESVREKSIEEILDIDFTEIHNANVTTAGKSTFPNDSGTENTEESSAKFNTPEKEPDRVGG